MENGGFVKTQFNEPFSRLDICRIILSFLIVMIHTSPLINISVIANYWIINGINRIAVPLFFSISGYLLENKLQKNDGYIFKWVFRIIKIYIIWLIIFAIVQSLVFPSVNTFRGYIKAVGLFLINNLMHGYFTLWYLPSLIIIGIIYYFVRNIKSGYVIIVAVIVYSLSLFGDTWSSYSNNIINHLLMALTGPFGEVRNSPGNGFVFFFIGASIYRNGKHVNIKKTQLLFYISLLLFISEIWIMSLQNSKDHNMYLSLIPLTYSGMKILTNRKNEKRIAWASNMSLYIYLVQAPCIWVIGKLLPQSNCRGISFSICVYLSSFIMSMAITVIAKKRKDNKIVGN